MANNIKNTHTLMINLLSFPEFDFQDTRYMTHNEHCYKFWK